MKRNLLRGLSLLATLGVLAAWAVTFRPLILGGPATYIVVRGDSMLPSYETGDLVITQAVPPYHVGEAVAYRVPTGELGAGLVVIHRIVGGDENGYVMEGDNNPSPDPWLPRSSDILGRAWLHAPGVGRLISLFFRPVFLACLAASVVVGWLVARRTRRQRLVPGWTADPG